MSKEKFRRNPAILSADLKGYSLLMKDDKEEPYNLSIMPKFSPEHFANMSRKRTRMIPTNIMKIYAAGLK